MKSLTKELLARPKSNHHSLAAQLFFIAGGIGLSLSFTMLPASSQSGTDEWVLEQNHVDTGKLSLYVCHDAVKIVSLQWGYQMVARAPNWTIHCFRPEEKIEWIGETSEFNGTMLNNPVAVGSKNETHLIPLGRGVMNGLKYTRYGQGPHSLSAIYGADDLQVARGAADFVSRFYHIPDSGKIPLYRADDRGNGRKASTGKGVWHNIDFAKDLRGGLIIELVTKSGKKVPYNASDFEYPRGCRRQRSLPAVAYSSKQKDSLNEVINDLGFVSEHDHAGKSVSVPNTLQRVKP